MTADIIRIHNFLFTLIFKETIAYFLHRYFFCIHSANIGYV